MPAMISPNYARRGWQSKLVPKLKFTRRVPFSPAQMLSLVGDLKSYPAFVPNCTDMQITPSGEAQLARMFIEFGPISQAYTSKVTVDKQAGSVVAHAVDGPFSHLDSRWRFTSEGEGTEIQFEIDFGFSNPLIAAVAEPAFAAKQDEIVDAFMLEAERRYG